VVVGQGGGGGCVEDCDGFAICENMEGAGTPASWSDTVGTNGTIDWDDTTATVLKDTQQLKMTRSGADVYSRFTLSAADTYYFHFRVKASDGTPAAAANFFHLVNATSGAGLYLVWRTDGNIRCFHGTNYLTTSTTPISGDNTMYHIWGQYTKATDGNNGVYKVWVNSSGDIDTATLVIDGSNGQCTAQITRAQPSRLLADGTCYFDQLYINTSAIGDVCD